MPNSQRWGGVGEAEIGWWWAVEMCDGDNETGLMLVEDFKIW